MPLYKRKTFLSSDDTQSSKLESALDVFQIRFTGEIFLNYIDYVNRLSLYRQRVWSCKATGKSNLTFEEALESEKKAQETVSGLPESIQRFCLEKIQYSTVRLDDLAKSIFDALKSQFFVGEVVLIESNGRMLPAKIISNRGYQIDNAEAIHVYEVDPVSSSEGESGPVSIPANKITRKKGHFSIQLIKRFIRESADRDLRRGSCWIINDSLAQKHNISIAMPKELELLLSKSNDENSALVANSLKISTGSQLAKLEDLKAKKKKYPIDDNELPLSMQVELPIPTAVTDLSTHYFGMMLSIWTFLQCFGKPLNLYSFSLDDFESCLRHVGDPPILISEIHVSLLSVIHDYRMDKDSEKESELVAGTSTRSGNIYRSSFHISDRNWQDYMLSYLESKEFEFSNVPNTRKLTSLTYQSLEIEAKLEVLNFLHMKSMKTDELREYMDESMEELTELKREVRGIKKTLALKHQTKGASGQANDAQSDSSDISLSDDEGASVKKKKTNTLLDDESIDTGKSRKEKLLELQQKKKVEELKREEELKRQKEENAKKRQESEQRRKEEEERRQLKRRAEQLEREILKVSVHRINPLGRDRVFSRYWFLDGYGAAAHTQVAGTGYLFVEKADSKWSYYGETTEIDALVNALNPKGNRERQLKKTILKNYNRISSAITRRNQELLNQVRQDDVRRSDRIKAAPKHQAYMSYLNKWRS